MKTYINRLFAFNHFTFILLIHNIESTCLISENKMATTTSGLPTLNGLAKSAVSKQLLDAETAETLQKRARKEQLPLALLLATDGKVDGNKLAQCASQEFGLPIIDLKAFNDNYWPTESVDEKLIRSHHALPLFKRGRKLYIAISDPSNTSGFKDIQFQTGLSVEAVLAQEPHLNSSIQRFLDKTEESIDDGFDDLDEDLDDVDISSEEGKPADEDVGSAADETPIVRFVNKVLLDAIRQGASDIHFEPYEKSYRVRFRTDGILQEKAKPPQNLSGRLAARLKVMSQMDISERRIPQDGRIKMKLSKKKAIDFRVNTLPTLWGEKIVLRILDPTSAQMGIDALGYEESQKADYMQALHQPQGMILVTGPTGSGKTVSLYTGLNILNTPERNISTAEDPVEINLEGINQVNVNNKVGMDFSTALRSFLRQDPDIIMVGEIRDLETGEIGIKAAQTGHLVLSTLHTNSAAETITRMLNMGIPAFNLATTVSLIIAQRLARRLCSNCSTPHSDVPEEILKKEGFTEEQIGNMTLMKPNANGCEACTRGYKGRVGIYEVVRITPALASIIMEGGTSIDIDKKAREEGFANLRQSALTKAASGVTSLEEVNRVTKD